MAKTEKNVSPLKSGPMFSHMIEPRNRVSNTKTSTDKTFSTNTAGANSLQASKVSLDKSVCGLTVIAKEAHRFLRLDWNESSDEVVDDGCNEDHEQKYLGLQIGKLSDSLGTMDLLNLWMNQS